MENSAKALYIAGSLLIALLVISLLVYTFSNIGVVQDQKDKIQSEEEIVKFNKEYDVYNKSIMYGVDVISCINKAVSNNEKYYKAGKWSISGASGSSALIQVDVKLKKELTETLTLYYIRNGKKESKIVGNLDQDVLDDLKKYQIKDLCSNLPKLTNITPDDNLAGRNGFNRGGPVIENRVGGQTGSWTLLDEEKWKKQKYDTPAENSLEALTSNASDMEISLQNPDPSTYYLWSRVSWKTALSDFKSRKFKCGGIEYNENNGLINKIIFEER